jgi:hypothetical protein
VHAAPAPTARLKKDMIWSVLKSITGLQGRKLADWHASSKRALDARAERETAAAAAVAAASTATGAAAAVPQPCAVLLEAEGDGEDAAGSSAAADSAPAQATAGAAPPPTLYRATSAGIPLPPRRKGIWRRMFGRKSNKPSSPRAVS